MKKILGLVVILAALVLGGYYGTGLMTEHTFKRSIEMMDQSTGFSVHVTQYQRHWFNSTAQLDVKIHIPERADTDSNGKVETIAAQDYTLDVPVKIYHGPIIYSGEGVLFGIGFAHSDLNLPNELKEKFSSNFTDQSVEPKLVFSVFVNYLNQSRFQVEIPAFKLVFKDNGAETEWQGLKGDMSVSSDLRSFNGNLMLKGIKFMKDKVTAVLSSMSSDYDVHKTEDGLFLGDAGISLPSFVISQDGKPQFDISQFTVRTDSVSKSGLFDTSFKTSFDKIQAHDRQYGPGLLEISIKNLDAKVLAQLNEQANKLKRATGGERQQIMFSMLPVLPKLFSKGPSFEVSTLKLTVPEGNIDGHLLVSLPKSENTNPFQLLQSIEGNGKLQVPSEIVKRTLVESLIQKAQAVNSPQKKMLPQMETPSDKAGETKQAGSVDQSAQSEAATKQATEEADKKLAALVDAKLLNLQGSDYVIEFQLSAGKFTVNGQAFDPSTFKL
jgi:uncharacterized protein YdgA (DUF945 family)